MDILDPNLLKPGNRKIKNILRDPSWDGSYLGNLSSEHIIGKITKNKFVFWKINFPSGPIICLVRHPLNKIPHQCVIDESKPLFGLKKLGTNWVNYGTGIRVLIKARTISQNKAYGEKRVSEYDEETIKLLIDKIKKNIVFREVMGIKSTNFSSLIVRPTIVPRIDGSNLITNDVLSIAENTVRFDSISVISNAFEEKLFEPGEKARILKRIFFISSKQDLSQTIINLKDKIEKITSRVSNETVTITDSMRARFFVFSKDPIAEE